MGFNEVYIMSTLNFAQCQDITDEICQSIHSAITVIDHKCCNYIYYINRKHKTGKPSMNAIKLVY